MKKIIFIMLLSFLSTCYSADSQKIIVLLDWFANPNHAPLFIAKEKGFFKEHGLEIELIGPADPSDPPKWVAAGKADVAITYQPQFMEQIDQGLPLIRIGTLIPIPLNCLTVLKETKINTIKELKGKRIGYSTGGVTDISLRTMLEKNGLTLNDVKAINIHYDLTQALLSGKVDAVTGMMRNFELIQLELAGHPGKAFYPEENGVPTYSELILVAHKDKIHDPKFKNFLIALKKGVDYLQKHPEESWTIFAKNHRELNDQLNHRAWAITTPYFAKHPEKIDNKNWLNFAKFLSKNKMIKKIQPLTTYSVDLLKE